LAQDDYYYEIQLTNKQLVFYFMAGATGLILSFLAGVMVGRGVDAQAGDVQAARAGQEERTIVEETPRPVSPAPSPAELTYAQRLESDRPDESLARPKPTPPAPSPTVVPKAVSSSPREVPPAARETAPARPPRREAPVETRPSPRPAPATARPAAKSTPAAAGPFTIQVGAFKDRGTADTVMARLKGKGYTAFVVPPDGSDGLFLVRVGRFVARADAERTEARLRDQEKFKPYIVKN
jgi:cell division septation protein DedD